MPFNPDIWRAWISALRSGEYAQTRTALRKKDDFCCLGVLCDVRKDATGEGSWMGTVFFDEKHGQNRNYAPVEYLGFDKILASEYSNACSYAKYADSAYRRYQRDLHIIPALMNDQHGYTFDDIADAMEVWIP